MKEGTGLDVFPNSFLTESMMWASQSGMQSTFAAGLAAGGLRPVVAVYSTFSSAPMPNRPRCLSAKLPVVFAIDRADLSERTVRHTMCL